MLAEKTWRPEAVMRLFFAVITTLCFGGLVASLIVQFGNSLSEDQRKFFSMVIMAVFFQGGTLIWIHLFLREEKLSWKQAFGFNAPGCALMIGLAILAAAITLPVLLWFQEICSEVLNSFKIHGEAQPLVQELQQKGLTVAHKVVFGIVAIIAAPLAEETLFRGILYPTIKQAGYPNIALFGTSFLFGLSHMNLISFLPLTLFAMVLVFLYEKTGNLLAPILTHSLFNTANFIVLLTQSS